LNGLRRSGNRVHVSIGGLADNEVGFVLADGELGLTISSDDYIWIEPLAGGWHLFRTT